jgi:hypothetical protein
MSELKSNIFSDAKRVFPFLLSSDIIQNDLALKKLTDALYEDITGLELLYERQLYRSASVLIRAICEKVINYLYLLYYPDAKDNFLDEDDLFSLKSSLIQFNILKEGREEGCYFANSNILLGWKRLITWDFNYMRPGAKKIILNALGLKKYTSNDSNIEKLNAFFNKNRKPFRQDLKKIYGKIDEARLKEKKFDIGVYNLIRGLYNDCSQYVHSSVLDNRFSDLYLHNLSFMINLLLEAIARKLNINLNRFNAFRD